MKKITAVKKPAAKKAAPAPTVTPIEAYVFKNRLVKAHHAFPFAFVHDENLDNVSSDVYEALDDIALAAESGQLTREGWVLEIFKTNDDFENFLDALQNYDDLWRIIDRWWEGLARLARMEGVEEDFITTAEMAGRLRYEASDSGQR